jgi:imidazolonepropionase
MKAYTHLNQLVTLQHAHLKDGRRLNPDDLTIINDGAIVFDQQQILWVGKTSELPSIYKDIHQISLPEHVLTPELVDAHTHVVFGGDRSQEYADRLNGVSYEEIAQRGGGILFTMNETQKLSEEELFFLATERIQRMTSYGVGTIEIKSGYGLSYKKEKEISLIIDRLKKHFEPSVQIYNTYLAAHDVPKNFPSSADYLEQIVLPLMQELAERKIIDAVDIFHEKNYFSTQDAVRLFQKAKVLKLPVKLHADELNDNDGATLAVDTQALSADHLLKISDKGINNLASSASVATILPGTALFLGKPLAPARKMLDAGIKMAIASDYNPGSCHWDNVLMVAAIAAAQLKINQAELWVGITLNAAHALGLKDQGALISGLKPRFSLFQTSSLSQITYNWGRNFAVSLP